MRWWESIDDILGHPPILCAWAGIAGSDTPDLQLLFESPATYLSALVAVAIRYNRFSLLKQNCDSFSPCCFTDTGIRTGKIVQNDRSVE